MIGVRNSCLAQHPTTFSAVKGTLPWLPQGAVVHDTLRNSNLLPPASEGWGKVIVSVCMSVHRGGYLCTPKQRYPPSPSPGQGTPFPPAKVPPPPSWTWPGTPPPPGVGTPPHQDSIACACYAAYEATRKNPYVINYFLSSAPVKLSSYWLAVRARVLQSQGATALKHGKGVQRSLDWIQLRNES